MPRQALFFRPNNIAALGRSTFTEGLELAAVKKPLVVIAVAILAFPVLLVLGVLIFIDPLVKTGIEKGGSFALQVPVHVKDASIRFSGHVTLTGFDVANPDRKSTRLNS